MGPISNPTGAQPVLSSAFMKAPWVNLTSNPRFFYLGLTGIFLHGSHVTNRGETVLVLTGAQVIYMP